MKRVLLLGAVVAAILVPAAVASPAATHTLRGTVVAKDRAHHALVVASSGGKVQTLVAPGAFARTHVGRRVVIRYTGVAGRLPRAVSVSLKGKAQHAVVRGTIVRLVKRHAIINAGGTVLNVTLKTAKRHRALASATSGPQVGDTVEVEVDIDDDGSLDASAVVVTGAPTAGQAASGGEMEVRGKVTELVPSTPTVSGHIILTVMGLPVRCEIPPGVTLNVKVDDMIELKCEAIGNPALWTVRTGHDEDAQAGDDDGQGSPGDDSDSGKVEVQGTIIASFTQLDTIVTVTPQNGGADVGCAIVAGSLPGFAAGDAVKMECLTVGATLTLKEIEKSGGDSGDDNGGDSGDDNGND